MQATSSPGPRRNVTVIGAGIVGMASAIHLQRDGHDVTVVDRLPPGEGTSFGNAGIMTPSAFVPVTTPGFLRKVPKMLFDPMGPLSLRWSYLPRALPWLLSYVGNATPEKVETTATALSGLTSGSVQEHQALARGTGAEPFLHPATYAYVYKDEAQFERESYTWGLRRRHGAKMTLLRGPEVREMEPAVAPDYTFAVALHDHGYVSDPSRLVKALAEQLERAGGRVLRREVRDIEIGPAGPTRLLTDADPLDLDLLIVAAGAWSGGLAKRLGNPVPLESERGYHVVLTDPGIAPRVAIMSSTGKFVATPMDMGLRVAGLVEFGGLEGAPNFKRARTLLKHVKLLYPDANTESFTEWMGHRPALPDSLPVIGCSPHFENVYFAFGHQHIGLATGPKTGRLIADLVAGRRPNIDISAFGIERFSA